MIRGLDLPILQAPMAGAQGAALAIAVAEAGALGAIPCALLDDDAIRAEVALFRAQGPLLARPRPLNVNFFCHRAPAVDPPRDAAWLARFARYYAELGVAPPADGAAVPRRAFDEAQCALVEELAPEVVSFHFGLPAPELVARVRAAGAMVLSTATTVAEAKWLEEHGADAIIAQGSEAGGHRGMFLATDPALQLGTFALVPQVVDAVRLPVVAAGGIADARGIRAAFALGARAVQIGTAYLFCPEATISPIHRRALAVAADDATVLTNVLTGRPARAIANRLVRELGPISEHAPEFPRAGVAMTPLRAAGSFDVAQMWSGQAAALARGLSLSARALTEKLAREAGLGSSAAK